jgi:hypothetical protein
VSKSEVIIAEELHRVGCVEIRTRIYGDEPVNHRMYIRDEIMAERLRQVDAEGWTEEHDDQHTDGELALAAGCYAIQATREGWSSVDTFYNSDRHPRIPRYWPWLEADSSAPSWKPGEERRDLIKAAALIVAEIERIDRLNRAADEKATEERWSGDR